MQNIAAEQLNDFEYYIWEKDLSVHKEVLV